MLDQLKAFREANNSSSALFENGIKPYVLLNKDDESLKYYNGKWIKLWSQGEDEITLTKIRYNKKPLLYIAEPYKGKESIFISDEENDKGDYKAYKPYNDIAKKMFDDYDHLYIMNTTSYEDVNFPVYYLFYDDMLEYFENETDAPDVWFDNKEDVYFNVPINVCSGNKFLTNDRFMLGDSYLTKSAITKVELSNNIEHITERAFENCANLTSIKYSNNVTHIGRHAFANCTSLSSVTLSSAITEIHRGTFYNSSITDIIIPPSVTKINDRVFEGCEKLEKLYIPDTVQTLDGGIVNYCSNLTQIRFPYYTTFNYDMKFFGCTSLTSLEISKGWTFNRTSMYSNMFKDCTNLSHIIYGRSLELTEWGTHWYYNFDELYEELLEMGYPWGCPHYLPVMWYDENHLTWINMLNYIKRSQQ